MKREAERAAGEAAAKMADLQRRFEEAEERSSAEEAARRRVGDAGYAAGNMRIGGAGYAPGYHSWDGAAGGAATLGAGGTASFFDDRRQQQRDRDYVLKDWKPPVHDSNFPLFKSLFELLLAREDLSHTLAKPASPDQCIWLLNGLPRSENVCLHGERRVSDHEYAFEYLMRARKGANLQARILAVGTVSGAWEAAQQFCLPMSNFEQEALKLSLTNMKMQLGEDPKEYLLRFDRVLSTLRAVNGDAITDREVLAMLRRNLSADYEQVHILFMANSSLTRKNLENLVRSLYAERDLGNVARRTAAVTATHTLFVSAVEIFGGTVGHGCLVNSSTVDSSPAEVFTYSNRCSSSGGTTCLAEGVLFSSSNNNRACSRGSCHSHRCSSSPCHSSSLVNTSNLYGPATALLVQLQLSPADRFSSSGGTASLAAGLRPQRQRRRQHRRASAARTGSARAPSPTAASAGAEVVRTVSARAPSPTAASAVAASVTGGTAAAAAAAASPVAALVLGVQTAAEAAVSTSVTGATAAAAAAAESPVAALASGIQTAAAAAVATSTMGETATGDSSIDVPGRRVDVGCPDGRSGGGGGGTGDGVAAARTAAAMGAGTRGVAASARAPAATPAAAGAATGVVASVRAPTAAEDSSGGFGQSPVGGSSDNGGGGRDCSSDVTGSRVVAGTHYGRSGGGTATVAMAAAGAAVAPSSRPGTERTR
ncbi:unnamed protein product [Ectocarpus sp. CCAP 1310/34]|nr:unnamed protein product [Ectocarpus sp. CCAP 1310/34]